MTTVVISTIRGGGLEFVRRSRISARQVSYRLVVGKECHVRNEVRALAARLHRLLRSESLSVIIKKLFARTRALTRFLIEAVGRADGGEPLEGANRSSFARGRPSKLTATSSRAQGVREPQAEWSSLVEMVPNPVRIAE